MLKINPTNNPQNDTYYQLINDLIEFVMGSDLKNYIFSASMIFWNNELPDKEMIKKYNDMMERNFIEWFLFDLQFEDKDFATVVEIYQKQNKNLSNEKMELLDNFKNSRLSLFEVQEVVIDKGLILKDLLLGGEYHIEEKLGTNYLFKWDIIAARIVAVNGNYNIGGQIYSFPVLEKDAIIKEVMRCYNLVRNREANESLYEFLKAEGVVFNDIWREYVKLQTPPKIVTKEGDLIMFCKAKYVFTDRERVIKKIEESKMFENDGKTSYIWVKKFNDKQKTVLGTIKITKKYLILECMSENRLKRGNKLLQKILNSLVVHVSNSVENFDEVSKKYEKKEINNQTKEIPLEVQKILFKEFMDKHMKEWFDKKIPILDNKTPRECVKTKEGKKKVIELLKMYENSQEKNKLFLNQDYDYTWVWIELGLSRDD